METRYKNFTGLILNISKCIQKIKNIEMKNLGYKGSQVEILFALYSEKKGMTSTELQKFCFEDKALISRTVKELSGQNLVFIEENSNQKYKNKIKLTEKGFEIGKIVTEKISKMVELSGRGIVAKDRENMNQSLSTILGNLTKICLDLEA